MLNRLLIRSINISDIDINIDHIQYLDDIPMIRDLPRFHNFSAHITNPSEYDIISLKDEYIYNFKLEYLLSSEEKSNFGVMFQNDVSSSNSEELYQRGLGKASGCSLLFSVKFDVNITSCEQLSYICVAISDLPFASWRDVDTTNNMMCVDIKEHIICRPGMN